MFKATEVERKTRKINLLIDLQKLIFSSIISHYLSCKCRKDSLGTKNVSCTNVQNWKVNKSLRQKRCGKWYHVYPPEIIQSTLLGRLWKNHWKTMTACIQRPYQNGASENLQQTMSLVRKITFKQIVEVLFQCF